jgi:hypothetical protein
LLVCQTAVSKYTGPYEVTSSQIYFVEGKKARKEGEKIETAKRKGKKSE